MVTDEQSRERIQAITPRKKKKCTKMTKTERRKPIQRPEMNIRWSPYFIKIVIKNCYQSIIRNIIRTIVKTKMI